MALETHRRALRSGLPWLVGALVLLTPSIAIPACVGPFLPAGSTADWVRRVSYALGAFGSGAMLIGLLLLARARILGKHPVSLMLAFAIWVVELALRLYAGSTDTPGSDTSTSDTQLIVKLCAATLAMTCLCGGMLTLLRRSQAFRELAAWHLARVLFALFLVALAAAFSIARWLAPQLGLWPWIESLTLGAPLAWLAFAAPWVALVHAVRRSVRWVARRQTVAEILTG